MEIFGLKIKYGMSGERWRMVALVSHNVFRTLISQDGHYLSSICH